MAFVYICGVMVLSYRVIYNEYYPILYEEKEDKRLHKTHMHYDVSGSLLYCCILCRKQH